MGKKKKENKYPSCSVAQVPRFELWFYRTVHVSVVVYITWCVYRASVRYDGLLNIYAFDPGWKVLGREQDISNYEWLVFSHWLWVTTPFYLGHVALNKIIQWNFPEYWRLSLVYSVAVLTYLMGPRVIFLYLLHCIIMYCVSLTHSATAVWITSLSLLTTLNFKITSFWTKYIIPQDEDDKEFYILAYTLAFMQLRYTSFCLEKCRRSQPTKTTSEAEPGLSESLPTEMNYMEKPPSEQEIPETTDCLDQDDLPCKHTFMDLLFYAFYFPLFFTGPVLTYDIFQEQVNSPKSHWTKERWKDVLSSFLRVIFWVFINEVLLHFLYFGAIQQNISVMNDIDLWTLAGIGYWSGQFFMTKYTVLFGYPACWGRLDGMDPPRGPKCIAYIYTYSDMWKYFDRGMYSFIKKYIFLPLGGSRRGVMRQVLASIACFMFVFYWHGSEYYIFLWTLFNFVGIAMEVTARLITDVTFVQKVQADFLNPAMVRRFHAICIIPLYLMSAITAFCFFGGSMVGYIFYDRVIIQGSTKSWMTVCFVLYCCIQSSIEITHNKEMDKTRKED